MDEYVSKSFRKALADNSGKLSCGEVENEMIVHKGTICDLCGISPIMGVRFTCMLCQKYDVCESCEDMKAHPAAHPMIKLKQPVETLEIERSQTTLSVSMTSAKKPEENKQPSEKFLTSHQVTI